MTGFVILGLPRSRTAWLAQFLSYGDWHCGHDELRHMRSLDDARAWFSQGSTGTVETAAAPWWRLLDSIAPGVKVVTIRRPVAEVIASLTRLAGYDIDVLTRAMVWLDRKLDQIEARVPGVISARYSDLADEATCAAIFEHCLPYSHDAAHWRSWDAVNVQINFNAMLRYCEAYKPALDKLSLVAKHRTIGMMARRKFADPEGVTLQTEDFDTWVRDAESLFNEHLVQVGEAPGDWHKKNIPLMRKIYDIGAMQVTTARCNGRMFGYLMTLIAPSLAGEGVTTGTHTTFFADPGFPGMGMKLQRFANDALKARGVDEVLMIAGVRGSAERISAIYRRLGAENNGQLYRLPLSEAA